MMCNENLFEKKHPKYVDDNNMKKKSIFFGYKLCLNQYEKKMLKVKYYVFFQVYDIMERTRIEFCYIYIDSTPPYIEMFGITHNDEKVLFVHRTDTWYPDMKLHYHAWDPHSNIYTMLWTFGTTEDGDDVGSGAMPVIIYEHNVRWCKLLV